MTTAGTVLTGDTYPLGYMNITSAMQLSGFIQLYAYSINNTQIRVTASPLSSRFATVGTIIDSTFNLTFDYDQLNLEAGYQSGTTYEVDPLGVVTASSSIAYFIGVKSDRGTTDAFLALPLMTQSTSFFVAGWPYNSPFYASCLVVPALSGTCVEVYKIYPGGVWKLMGGASLQQYDVYRHYVTNAINPDGSLNQNANEDMTGYFINATKPIQVLCGHECANVPSAKMLFCDHMVEQIPPINQLGTFHVVPPIGGRSASAGYVVRVVSTAAATLVTWTDNLNSTQSGTSTIDPGNFTQITTWNTMRPLIVQCSAPCIVMQYNKGFATISKDVPTDPFMMLTVPSDHFTAGAGFATANYCDTFKNRIVFDDWLTIVTFAAYKDQILYDGQPLTSVTYNNQLLLASWDTTSVPGYAITVLHIDHNFHYVNMAPGTFGSFAAYVYGHSILSTSTSAYGFAANYNMTGNPLTEVWQQSIPAFNQYLKSLLNESCSNDSVLVGNILSGKYVTFPFTLTASFSPVSDPNNCFVSYYNLSIWTQLTQFTHLINYWICTTQNCSYLDGVGVALNYNTLQVQFLQQSPGVYNGIYISVDVIASTTTVAADFAQCRLDVKNFMTSFVNWPYAIPELFPTPVGLQQCPWPLGFPQPAFVTGSPTCAAGM